jgi:hypothetical protein
VHPANQPPRINVLAKLRQKEAVINTFLKSISTPLRWPIPRMTASSF